MSVRKFSDWLTELREIVYERFECALDEMPEFDISDARSYYKEGGPPSIYFDECLSEHGEEGEELGSIMQRVQ